MVYDTSWDMPQANWEQQGSWEQGSIPPTVEPTAGTQICLGPVAQEWVPWIAGACDQMRNPSAWIVADDTAMYNTLRRVDTLLGLLFGSRGACSALMIRLEGCELQTSSDSGVTWTPVPGWDANFCTCVTNCNISLPPLLPPGSTPDTRACNIAGYLADHVIHEAITQAIQAYNNNLSLLAFAGNVAAATFAFELPWAAAFVFAAYDVYQFFTATNISALTASEADPSFWNLVRCAIYSAIKTDGLITTGNCAAVISNICGITYTHPVAVSAVCAFVTQLGCDQLRAIQVAGALNSGDCSACGAAWCHFWDFRTVDPTVGPGAIWSFDAGTWRSGYGMEGANVSNTQLVFEVNFTAAHVNRVAIHYTCENVNGSAPRQIEFYLAGSHVATLGLPGAAAPQPAGVTVDQQGFDHLCDRIQFTIDSTYNLDTIFGQSVTLYGPANTPFGADNCPP